MKMLFKYKNLIFIIIIFVSCSKPVQKFNRTYYMGKFFSNFENKKYVSILDMHIDSFVSSNKSVHKELFFASLLLQHEMIDLVEPILKKIPEAFFIDKSKRFSLKKYILKIKQRAVEKNISYLKDIPNIREGRIYTKDDLDTERIAIAIFFKALSRGYTVTGFIGSKRKILLKKEKKFFANTIVYLNLRNGKTGMRFSWQIGIKNKTKF